MENELILNGSLLEVASREDDDIHIKFLICPLNELNANGTGIRESDLSEAEKYGLKNKAIVTKVVRNEKGELDFSGHNVKIVNKIDGNGNVYKDYDFDTNPVGFHTEVSVEDIEINGQTKRCIVADAIVWSRYNKVVEVIKRLGTNLRTSWEIGFSEAYYEDGGKWIKGLNWLGNCLLSSSTRPAYQIAGALEISEANEELQLALAATEDLINLGEIPVNNNKEEGGILVEENKITETASIEENKAPEIASVEENKVPETVSLSMEDKEKYESEIAELKQKLSDKEAEISTKLDEIIKLGETIKAKDEEISNKDTEIAELRPYREQVEAAQAEAKKAEIEAAQEVLKEKLISSKYFTKEEVEASEELMKAISELDEKAIKEAIGAKVLEYASQEKPEEKVETSEENKKENEVASIGLSINYSYKSNLDKNNSAIMSFINS